MRHEAVNYRIAPYTLSPAPSGGEGRERGCRKSSEVESRLLLSPSLSSFVPQEERG